MKRFIPTRWSHLLGFSGVGALLRADNDLFVVMDIGHWTDPAGQPAGEPLWYVDLLRSALGLDDKRLLQPPLARLINNGVVDGTAVPALRFPSWSRCPSCGLLHHLPWRDTRQQSQQQRLQGEQQEKQQGGQRGRQDTRLGKDALEDPRCQCAKRSRLRQVDWVVAHAEGGLWDVPWHWLAHGAGASGSGRSGPGRVDQPTSTGICQQDPAWPALTLLRDAESGRWTLRCRKCGASQGFSPGQELKDVPHPRLQPWQKGAPGPSVRSQRNAQILEVNDPRLFYARVRTGLVIPPESQVERGGLLDRLYCNHAARTELAQARNGLARGALLRRLSAQFGCTREALEDALAQIEAGWPTFGARTTRGQLLEQEYRALITPIEDQREGEDFVTEHQTAAWRVLPRPPSQVVQRLQVLHAGIAQLVAVTRLREIRVFTGFHRVEQWFDDGIKPDAGFEADHASDQRSDGSSDLSRAGHAPGGHPADQPGEPARANRQSNVVTGGVDAQSAHLVPPDLDGRLDWLPAIELFGEGIFFTLDEAMLQRWETQPGLQRRAEALERRLERTGMSFADEPPLPLPPRFLLLHTLAHLLIRRLETEAGYPAASIRERLYCSAGPEPMAGILVYVAVADVAGSLGGLAELAAPERFLPLLAGVFDQADWCSLDPVCAEHEGQGPSQLNRAACHACALVPEPSCQFGNVLLDRVFVAGDLGGGIRPLLAFAEAG